VAEREKRSSLLQFRPKKSLRVDALRLSINIYLVSSVACIINILQS